MIKQYISKWFGLPNYRKSIKKASGNTRKKKANSPEKKIKRLLNRFWSLWNGIGQSEKIRMLLDYSRLNYSNIRARNYLDRKVKFNRSAIRKEMQDRECIICGSDRNMHAHHIIQLQHGGFALDRRNVIPLCFDCHSIIHPWMKDRIEDKIEKLNKEFNAVVGNI